MRKLLLITVVGVGALLGMFHKRSSCDNCPCDNDCGDSGCCPTLVSSSELAQSSNQDVQTNKITLVDKDKQAVAILVAEDEPYLYLKDSKNRWRKINLTKLAERIW